MAMNQTVWEYERQVGNLKGLKVGERYTIWDDLGIAIDLMKNGHGFEDVKGALGFTPMRVSFVGENEIDVLLKYVEDIAVRARDTVAALKDMEQVEAVLEAGVRAYREIGGELIRNGSEDGLDISLDINIAKEMVVRGFLPDQIRQAILEASPLVRIRDIQRLSEDDFRRKLYTDSVLEEANFLVQSQGGQKTDMDFERVYAETRDYYLKQMGSISEKDFHMFRDGRIVRDLMGNQDCSREILERVLAENSPNAKSRDFDPKEYAVEVIDGVHREMKAERDVLDLDVSKEIRNIFDVYRLEAKKYLEMYPLMTFNGYMDEKIAKILLDGGKEQQEVVRGIAAASPVAKRPGVSISYAVDVVNRVVLSEGRKMSAKDKTIKKYIQYATEIRERYPNKELGSFEDGRIAERLLKEGANKQDVMDAIAECSINAQNVKEKFGTVIEKYSYAIVTNVEKSLTRISQARGNEQGESSLIFAEYQRLLKDFLNDNVSVTMSVDIKISKEMLAKGFGKEEIIAVLGEASPVAVYPGYSTKTYGSYVVEKAIRSEERKESPCVAETTDRREKVEVDRFEKMYGMAMDVIRGKYKDCHDGQKQEFLDARVADLLLENGNFLEDVVRVMEFSPKGEGNSFGIGEAKYSKGIAVEAAIRELSAIRVNTVALTASDGYMKILDEVKMQYPGIVEMANKKQLVDLDGVIACELLRGGHNKKMVSEAIGEKSLSAPNLSHDRRKYGEGVVKEIDRKMKMEGTKLGR